MENKIKYAFDGEFAELVDEALERVSSLVDEQDASKLKGALIISELHKFNLMGNALQMFHYLEGNEAVKGKMCEQFLIAIEFLINIEDFFKENYPEDYEETLSSWESLHRSYKMVKYKFETNNI